MAVVSPHLGAKPSAIDRLVHYPPIPKNLRHHARRAGSDSRSGATSPVRLFRTRLRFLFVHRTPRVELLRSSGRRVGPPSYIPSCENQPGEPPFFTHQERRASAPEVGDAAPLPPRRSAPPPPGRRRARRGGSRRAGALRYFLRLSL